ncbi:hypothetical protein GWK48_10480 [Metallosphaera tengchongensis]|uniref:Uncharacterized protein n=1 Tax=Metallosphaera tengchongensis TaxID=1532350 RepID=A0A6N0NZH9_9CREN|nr:hypothetical protein [Metallosphaera tengchongensis]QKR00758.1 hypothetical protein GWK48_10480 [Metallosphaera tengchongensis]
MGVGHPFARTLVKGLGLVLDETEISLDPTYTSTVDRSQVASSPEMDLSVSPTTWLFTWKVHVVAEAPTGTTEHTSRPITG